ncbi:hypothetical protein IWW36_003941 [Coemansia brasiliensis]|uniref:HMG box domain-containing protein n=1 Tax=Coemansia brasiliensis TaxID=2650707 RepID=A0A9W8I6V4_9FUNG|nr:hypothetical protein IWW36_003941 [Coemansia brasiliensis]
MMLGEAQVLGVDLSAVFAQELDGLAYVPKPVSPERCTEKILVNRVPDGFTPILIDLQRCSRSELRRFLHNMLCTPQSENTPTSSPLKDKPLGRCKCELVEFDYQPDFMFNRNFHSDQSEDYTSDSECSDDDSDGDITNSCQSPSDTESVESEITSRVHYKQEAERNRIKIKRPPNSFMIYRSQRHNELVKEYKGGNKVISGIIAKEWHSMPATDKKTYEEMAAEKKREHEMLYPNYKFMPKRRKL